MAIQDLQLLAGRQLVPVRCHANGFLQHAGRSDLLTMHVEHGESESQRVLFVSLFFAIFFV